MPATITPVGEDGMLDLRATKVIIEHFLEAGSDGIWALGSIVEFSTSTEANAAPSPKS